MKFYSTNRKSPVVSFREAVIKSLPDDNGLYFPETVPELDSLFLATLSHYSLAEVGQEVMRQFCSEDIPDNKLNEIVKDAIGFEIPLMEVGKNTFALELFHGPTYAFKDVGARFLARCLGYFNESENKEVTILVATSGDTGGAVAAGFYKVPGVKVVILYPSGKVSDLQEKQLTTLGENISAIEIEGDFDACQALVKHAFLDKELNQKLNLSSANSINIARWIPQSIYYYQIFRELGEDVDAVIAVPSGNYGNITSGMLAKKMGLPIKRFIAASNANDIVPRFLQSGSYEVKPTMATYSNAMDVSNPSNFPRMMELYGGDLKALRKDIKGFTLSDEDTLKVMKGVYDSTDYLLDPHGAIGYKALEGTLEKKEFGIFLETAHPCKFQPVIEKALGKSMPLPDFVSDLMKREKKATKMKADYEAFKGWLV